MTQAVDIPAAGRFKSFLRGFGWVKVFQKVSRDGGLEYWATNDIQMTEEKQAELEKQGWRIEVYHQGLKQLLLGRGGPSEESYCHPQAFAPLPASFLEARGVSLEDRGELV